MSSPTKECEHFTIRPAEVKDLGHIHELIRQSFAAMEEYSAGPWRTYADSLINSEMQEAEFRKIYIDPEDNHFWVAANAEGVIGCVGLKRLNSDEAELVRMSVDSKTRGSGIGQKLVEGLIAFTTPRAILRISLTTANPRAARFYQKCGFITVKSVSRGKLTGFQMIRFLADKVVRNVAIVGGTHGNERLGVELVRQWQLASNADLVKRSTFKTSVLIGNPAAVKANRRYIDRDLNRQFSAAFADTTPGLCEVDRAAEINELLGPKEESIRGRTGVDFVIDLHSSTSNMGLVAMISAADHDCLARRLCHHLLHLPASPVPVPPGAGCGDGKVCEEEEEVRRFPGLRVTSSRGSKADSYSLDSIPPSGVAFEVGPVAHGTVRSEELEDTRALVFATLDYLEAHNLRLLAAAAAPSGRRFDGAADALGVTVVRGRDLITAERAPSAFPQRRLTANTTTGSGDVTEPESEFGELECFEQVATVLYPRDGEILKAVVHPELEGRDWNPVEEGDAVLVTTDGRSQTIRFKRPAALAAAPLRPGPPLPPGPPVIIDLMADSDEAAAAAGGSGSASGVGRQGGEEPPATLYGVFVNEAAYYDKHVAFALYSKASKVVY